MMAWLPLIKKFKARLYCCTATLNVSLQYRYAEHYLLIDNIKSQTALHQLAWWCRG